MKKDLTLVILAAGMGSRYGGLKQIEPVGPNGEFIIDYSIYDAVKAGFTKVVFIIKEDIYDVFKETIGKRCEPYIKVEYAIQDFSVPAGYVVPTSRVKPLGTAHALYCASKYVTDNFAIISADDFYGRDAFMRASEYLKNSNEYCVIGYKIGTTLSDKGSVKRGVCMQQGDYLTRVIESKVERVEDRIVCLPLNGDKEYIVNENHPVSMIMFGLTPRIFAEIGGQMGEYFESHQDDMDTCEFLLPDVLDKLIQQNKEKIKVIETNSIWHGVTYKEDTAKLKSAVDKLIANGEYPQKLWNK